MPIKKESTTSNKKRQRIKKYIGNCDEQRMWAATTNKVMCPYCGSINFLVPGEPKICSLCKGRLK